MKSYHGNLGAGIAGIMVKDHDEPRPAAHEALVRVRAASLNARELMILRGVYPLPIKRDVVLLADGAGEVAAVGEGVTRVKPGDRVACAVFPQWVAGRFGWQHAAQIGGSLDGMLTQLTVQHEEALVHIPGHLTFEEAATLPCAAVTAWNALTGGRPAMAGETVITLGSGSVSLFALQLAKISGMRVIATTSSDAKAEKLRALGADAVINYNATPDWHTQIRELTGGLGAEHVIEVGGAGTLEKSLKSAAIEGEVALVGWLANQASNLDIRAVSGSVATMRRIAVGSRSQFDAMNRAISVNRLKPVIDRVFSFADAVAAFRHYEAGRCFGKVVISID